MNAMKVAFRADASLQIGTGHVMRCLTLADALAAHGTECRFICREHTGNLIEFIRGKGFAVHALSAGKSTATGEAGGAPLAHAAWLGASQPQDAAECATLLAVWQPDWLIVDHYALAAQWEKALNPHYRKLMVIDDLADREHRCDLLLDQTFGRNATDYAACVPVGCKLLCGSQYALLRPEFPALRPYSLQRRAKPQLRQLLITMGGVDQDNATGKVLTALHSCELPADCRIVVVMGPSAPWLGEVQQQAGQLPWPTKVMVNVSDMAQLMADSDLAIGAAGATSWERCCLGLPTVLVVLAENQRLIARGLREAGAAWLIERAGLETFKVIAKHVTVSRCLVDMSATAARITDGLGASRVASYMRV